MQKLEENKENVEQKETGLSWNGVEKTLASEMINRSEKAVKLIGIGLACVTIVGIAGIGFLSYVNHQQTVIMHNNEKEWGEVIEKLNQSFLDYLSQYDFVSQDGEGTNYYNSDVGGDVNNGATGTEEEEPQKR